MISFNLDEIQTKNTPDACKLIGYYQYMIRGDPDHLQGNLLPSGTIPELGFTNEWRYISDSLIERYNDPSALMNDDGLKKARLPDPGEVDQFYS